VLLELALFGSGNDDGIRDVTMRSGDGVNEQLYRPAARSHPCVGII
jgi:hypothetical protein